MTITRSPAWWKSATVYQIYPASFKDSNGDGIGDIQGIFSKLDYLADLGIDVIWVCPHYDSPQVDMGYDIADYEDIYPPYGSLGDTERLIAECHARGMKIWFDLVINHTSNKHKWFEESRSSKSNSKRDWYIWRPAKYDADGNRYPPNNWRSVFGGGSAWEWDETTQEYYLHLFAVEQPDLNFINDQTRQAVYASAIEFWLDRGVDGFRVDTVNLYSKPAGLPDAPVGDPDADFQPAWMLYANGPKIHEYIGEMNSIMKRYGGITVGELPHTENERVLKYVSAAANQLDMVFQFDVVDVGSGKLTRFDTVPRNFTLREFKDAVKLTQELIRGNDAWTTAFLENHDQARSISRFASDSPEHRVASGKMLALMESSLSGTLYIYQGQEIGMINAPRELYPFAEYKDVNSILAMQDVKNRSSNDPAAVERCFTALQHLARDHARIPFSWDGSPDGGFSDASKLGPQTAPAKPWMAAHPLTKEINAAAQVGDEHSVLSFWKRMLSIRKKYSEILVYGDFELLFPEDNDLFVFIKDDRRGGKMLVMLNFTDGPKQCMKPTPNEIGQAAGDKVHFNLLVSSAGREDSEILMPFEGRLYEILP